MNIDFTEVVLSIFVLDTRTRTGDHSTVQNPFEYTIITRHIDFVFVDTVT